MITTHHISDAPVHEIKTWIRKNAHGKHKKNYETFEFDNNIKAISVERYDGINISCVSSVYSRDWYPDGCVRIFNRWIATRKLGGIKENILSDRAIKMATQQIHFAEMMGYKSFFISYHSYIPRFCNELAQRLSDKTEWNWNHSELVQVTPSTNLNSYQHIIHTGEGIETLINRTIDLNSWRKLC